MQAAAAVDARDRWRRCSSSSRRSATRRAKVLGQPGQIGELWLVDVAAARAVCRRPFAATMPNSCSGLVEATFLDTVRRHRRRRRPGSAPPRP